MNTSNELLMKTLESFGPKVFEMNGSFALWVEVIQTFDNNSMNCLLELIESMDAIEKYNLAKRILREGFDEVINEYKRNTIATTDQVEEESQQNRTLVANEDIAEDIEEEKSEDSNSDDNEDIEEEVPEGVLPAVLTQEDTQRKSPRNTDSSGSYGDALEGSQPVPATEQLSQTSYKSCVDSSPTYLFEDEDMDCNESEDKDKSLELLFESQTETHSATQSLTSTQLSGVSTPKPSPSATDRLSGQILSLSPITSFYSQSKASISPTLSLNTSLISEFSPKSSMSSRSPGKRFPKRSVEMTAEEYNTLVPYESYCSEKHYFTNETPLGANESPISDALYEALIEENIKIIESNDSSDNP